MLSSLIHRILGAHLLNTDDPRIAEAARSMWDPRSLESELVEEKPLWTLVCFILNQFLYDRGAVLTMTVCQSSGLLKLNQLMQVPLEWEPPEECQGWPKSLDDIESDSDTTDSSASSPEDYSIPTTKVIDRTKPLKWAWIELMPVPGYLFSHIWKLFYSYMRLFCLGYNKGVLVVRHDRKYFNLSVTKHEGSLIVIQRQA